MAKRGLVVAKGGLVVAWWLLNGGLGSGLVRIERGLGSRLVIAKWGLGSGVVVATGGLVMAWAANGVCVVAQAGFVVSL